MLPSIDMLTLNPTFEAKMGNASAQEANLEEVSQEFEAVLTATMLKEGLTAASESWRDENEEDSGSTTYMQMAHEQMAYFIGRQGTLGIADNIKQQLREAAHLIEGMKNGKRD